MDRHNDEAPVVVIIGAGPAGLTAALEVVRRGKMRAIVLEELLQVGGISRTVEYKGKRMDIGGHRFFSKSEWVTNWWKDILPDPQQLLTRNRLSRIYFLRKYFDYPLKLSASLLRNLGALRLARMGISYLKAMAFPRKPCRNLEDFFVNRFGQVLYEAFFRDYTEKVWGVPCRQLSAEWGAQRIKGLSILSVLKHAMRGPAGRRETQTSLIEQFLYPRHGPGQLWEEVARRAVAGGAELRFGVKVDRLEHDGQRITGVVVRKESGERCLVSGTHFISTMPVKHLVEGLQPSAPQEVTRIAQALPYRDFITVGLLVGKMLANAQSNSGRLDNLPPDNWIYIQEPDVQLGRLQVFNNWSPDLVAGEGIWLGLEYFCQEGDALWTMCDQDLMAFAAMELAKIGMIDAADVLDATVIRVPKAYPAYFGAYEHFGEVRNWLERFDNLYLVGRNGMHRYNNQDHSMLTAKLAVDVMHGVGDKQAIWAVNIDDAYHEKADA